MTCDVALLQNDQSNHKPSTWQVSVLVFRAGTSYYSEPFQAVKRGISKLRQAVGQNFAHQNVTVDIRSEKTEDRRWENIKNHMQELSC